MDIFNRKRIKELERKLFEAKTARDRYRIEASTMSRKLEEIGRLAESEPEGCVRGHWCKACEFARTFHITEYYGFYSSDITPIYVCGKGDSCKNFVPNKAEVNNGDR